MYEYDNFFELIFENLKRIVLPEAWLTLDTEMSKQEFFTLMIVDKLGEITMSQISDQMNFPMSTATGIVDRLVKKGYIQRGKNEFDRRIVSITLTEKGRHLVNNSKTNISAIIKLVYDSLDEEERKYLFKIFSKILEVFQQLGNQTEKETDDKNTIIKIPIE